MGPQFKVSLERHEPSDQINWECMFPFRLCCLSYTLLLYKCESFLIYKKNVENTRLNFLMVFV